MSPVQVECLDSGVEEMPGLEAAPKFGMRASLHFTVRART